VLLPVGPLLGPIICGPNSTLYFRRQFAYENASEGPVTALSTNGRSKTIDLKEGTGLLERVIFSAFNVDANGNLYAIGNSSRDWAHSYLVAYDKGGQFVWKSSLNQPIHASFVLPLGNNRFLISGTLPQPAGQRLQSVTSLFDGGGNELRSLKLPDDDSEQSADPQTGTFFNPTISLGDAKLGPDGNVYLFKASSVPRVIVMDTEGKTLRTLKLTPPAENAQPEEFFISRQWIAVAYLSAQGDRQVANGDLALYNPETGVVLQMYHTPGGGILTAIEDNALIYMGPTPDHRNYRLGRAPLT